MKSLDASVVEHLRNIIDLPDLQGTKYRAIEKIGSGGMGVVYRAEDTVLEREVALKVINDSGISNTLAERTLREARFIAQLEHPGIVPIHDAGTLADGRVFYVMNRVQGKRLDEIIRSGESHRDLLRLFQKICEPLAFAHSRRVIHRDLKPENIMVGNYGEVLIMDWGTAKNIGSRDESVVPFGSIPVSDVTVGTVSGTIIGTPGFMAPEQEQGRIQDQDARTDLYALGCILHYMLTGDPPLQGKQRVSESPGKRRKTISKQLAAICAKLLSPNPVDRYASVEELSSDITRYLDGLPVTAYRENIIEVSARWFNRNQALIWIVVAYLVMRTIILIFFDR